MRLTRTDRADRAPAGRRRAWIAGAAAATALALLGAAPSATAAAPAYPVGDLGTAVANFVLSPDAVAGANNWHCTPSPEHPDPVVLVHATFVDLGANWAVLSPTLANEGYCVYAFNYGMNWLSAGRIGGLGDIPQSARTLQSFVDTVLRRTGASRVDLVGHSQGGLMPNYYIKRLGGAAKVRRFVALAPSNHGTTLNGIVTLGRNLDILGFANNVLSLLQLPGLVQQEQGSAFEQALFADGDTVPGPRYTVIETNKDTVVTPYSHAFLTGPAVHNVLIQDQCADDPVGHIGMFADGPALQDVLNALGADDPGFQPACSGYGLPL